MTRLEPLDIVCVAGVGRISNAIRWATRLPGEAESEVSHVAFVAKAGTVYTAEVQEALLERRRIVRRPLGEYAGTGASVAVWRPLGLTEADRAAMLARADETRGTRYGYPNLVLHLIDGLAGKALRRRVRFATRFALRSWQECSANVSDVWAAAGLTFGVATGAASPDDVADFCTYRPDKYALVRSLQPIPAELPGQRMESAA